MKSVSEKVATLRRTALSEEESQLKAGGVDVLDEWDIAIALDVCWAGIPFASGLGRRLWVYFAKLCCHILSFWELFNTVVVKKYVQALTADVNRAKDLSGLKVTLCSQRVDKVFQCPPVDVDCTVKVVGWCSTNYTWLDVEASNWLDGGFWWWLVILVNAYGLNPA
jgi:hypothetical protein